MSPGHTRAAAFETTTAPTLAPADPSTAGFRFVTKLQKYIVRDLRQHVAYRLVWRAIRGRQEYLDGHSMPVQDYDCRWWLPTFIRAPQNASLCSRSCGTEAAETSNPECSVMDARQRRRSSVRNTRGGSPIKKAQEQPQVVLPQAPQQHQEQPSHNARAGVKALSPNKVALLSPSTAGSNTPHRPTAGRQPGTSGPTSAVTMMLTTPVKSSSKLRVPSIVPEAVQPQIGPVNEVERGCQTDEFIDYVGGAGGLPPGESIARFATHSAKWFRAWTEGTLPSAQLLQLLSDSVGLAPAYDAQGGADELSVEARPLEWTQLSEHCRTVLESVGRGGGNALPAAASIPLDDDDPLVARAAICSTFAAANEALLELQLFKRRKTTTSSIVAANSSAAFPIVSPSAPEQLVVSLQTPV